MHVYLSRRFQLLFLLMLLTACGGVPLAEVDLAPLLVQPGNLPAGVTAAQVSTEPPEMFRDVPEPQQAIHQQFERRGTQQGGVTVLLYDAPEDGDVAYNVIAQGMPETRAYVPWVGAAAVGGHRRVNVLGVPIESVDVVFVRCHAVAHIRMPGTARVQDVRTYAKRLDARLQAQVC